MRRLSLLLVSASLVPLGCYGPKYVPPGTGGTGGASTASTSSNPTTTTSSGTTTSPKLELYLLRCPGSQGWLATLGAGYQPGLVVR